MSNSEAWYVIKQSDGHCEVLPAEQVERNSEHEKSTSGSDQWGPFESEAEAIARRVGLIRAGKCQPV